MLHGLQLIHDHSLIHIQHDRQIRKIYTAVLLYVR